MKTPFEPSHFEGLESRQLLAVDLTAALVFTTQGALAAGTGYTAGVDVSNSGEALPQIPVRVHLFASPGATYNPAASTLLAATTLANSPRWGGSEHVDMAFTVPTTIANGEFSLFALVDPLRAITESDESNNFSAGVPVTITGGTGTGGGQTGTFDLVSSVSLANPQIVPNTPVRASVSIQNTGTGAITAGTFVQLFLASGATPSPATDLQLGLRVVGNLAPGATDTADMEFTLTPQQSVGTVRLYAVADLSNQTVETNETNNVSAVVNGVGIGGVSDLSGAFVSESLPSQVVQGQKASSRSSIKFTVRNAGDYPITRGISVVTRAYLRPLLDASGAGDIAVSDAKRVSVGNLAPQASRNVELRIKTPTTLAAQDYWLIVKIDDTNVLAEFTESNNTIDQGVMLSVVPATVDPGITAGSMTFTSPTATAKRGSVTLTLGNLGNSLYKGALTVQLFFRDASGAEIGLTTFNKNVNLKPGGAARLSSLRISSPAAPGDYALAARLILPEGVVDIGPVNNSWELGAISVA